MRPRFCPICARIVPARAGSGAPRLYCGRRCRSKAERRRLAARRPARRCRLCTRIVGRKHQLCTEHLKYPPPRTSRPRLTRCACGAPVPPERLRWCSEVCLQSHRVERLADQRREETARRIAAEKPACPCGRPLPPRTPGGRRKFCAPCVALRLREADRAFKARRKAAQQQRRAA